LSVTIKDSFYLQGRITIDIEVVESAPAPAGVDDITDITPSAGDGTPDMGVSDIGQPGDVDGDGYIRAQDASLAARCAVRLEVFNEIQKRRADMNSDGHITALDAAMIARRAVGLY